MELAARKFKDVQLDSWATELAAIQYRLEDLREGTTIKVVWDSGQAAVLTEIEWRLKQIRLEAGKLEKIAHGYLK